MINHRFRFVNSFLKQVRKPIAVHGAHLLVRLRQTRSIRPPLDVENWTKTALQASLTSVPVWLLLTTGLFLPGRQTPVLEKVFPGLHPKPAIRGKLFQSVPPGASLPEHILPQFRPVLLISLHHFIQNLLCHKQAGNGL